MAQAASKTCEICVSGPGHNYCEQCDQLFCDGCKISHLRTKMTKNHTFRSGPNINPEVKQYCKEHDENFIYYCKECDAPICKICVIKKHKSHNFAEIKESTDGIKAEVKMVIDTEMRNLQSKIADIDQGSNQYKIDINGVIIAIRKEGRHLKDLIDKKVESLVKSVKEKEAKNLQSLQSIDKEIKTALDKAKEQQKIYKDTQGIKDTTKLFQKLKQLKSHIDQIEEILVPIMPSVKYAEQKVGESEIKKLFGELFLGNTSTPAALSNTTCSMCLDRQVDVWLMPCGHTACEQDAQGLQMRDNRCHVCRVKITGINKLCF
ncbi:tripartite motif-containing protein 33 [Mytilus galloprovincialis]|uniref:Tripartite motif-containing protein 33 n=1 Tax=Mytilus galloprovincialis TaxID=29158 RepID=A0A8B6CVT9_MYTGA|nr:tripartite motif-containing protein 33 [Mytilus galloprovincialis]